MVEDLYQDTFLAAFEMRARIDFLRTVIKNVLTGLDDKFHIPLILHYFKNLNLEAIAQICNVIKVTIKSCLHKGRLLLKTTLEKKGF